MSTQHTVRLAAFHVDEINGPQHVPPHLQYLQIEDTGGLPFTDWASHIGVERICEVRVQEILGADFTHKIVCMRGAPSRGLTLDVLALVPECEHEHMHWQCSWVDFFQPDARLSRQERDALTASHEMLKENLEHGDGRFAFDLVDRLGFTASELRRAYEAVLHKPLDRSNFQKKVDRMIDAGTVSEIRGRMRQTLTRPASLYRRVG